MLLLKVSGIPSGAVLDGLVQLALARHERRDLLRC
jgi:hypothetical protein